MKTEVTTEKLNQTQELRFPVQPMHNNLLIKKVNLVEESKIVISGQKEQTQNTARVLAVGPGRQVGETLIPPRVKAGDLILTGGQFSVYRVGDQEFCLINENSVVGIIDETQVNVEAEKPAEVPNDSTILLG